VFQPKDRRAVKSFVKKSEACLYLGRVALSRFEQTSSRKCASHLSEFHASSTPPVELPFVIRNIAQMKRAPADLPDALSQLDEDVKKNGSYYRLDADHQVSRHFDPVFTTNGLAFSPDGTVMYYADTNRDVQTIWACDYDPDSGTPSNSRVFFHSGEVAGRPDGATVDADGCYWFAGVGGWQLVRVTPRGKLDRIIEVPVEKPSKVMFGGAGLDTLFVTSISDGVEDRVGQPEAGSLFAVTGIGTVGVPQIRFAG